MQGQISNIPFPKPEGLLVALLGPTATGKSRLALAAAAALDGEIINCDSMQMYRHLQIGTTKPTPEQRMLAPHHLYDLVDPDEYFGAGRYMKEARRVCREIASRGKISIVVGGTGLYLRALLEGVFEGPGRSEEIRERLKRVEQRRGLGYLYAWIEEKDPGAARKIQPQDRIRIIRTLEIYLLTGKPISELQAHREPLKNLSILKIGINLPREVLYDRINRRVNEMFRSGLVEEVQQLLDRGYGPECKGFQALGYRHAMETVRGGLSREEAIARIQMDTRRYAKRQMTWFRQEKEVHWLTVPGEDPTALDQLTRLVHEHRDAGI
ncbi:MAG: tRNA (adenosine(37)-N6)-dimethylallyltransferase MiaA [Acidobacteriota bacterium]